MVDGTSSVGGPGFTEAINQLTNIARQLSYWSQSITNSQPVPTTTSSPKFTAVTLGTSAITTVIGSSTIRHGIIFHNPGTTNTCYIFPTNLTPVPTTSSLAGTIAIAPGAYERWPSSQYTNINAAFSGLTSSGSGVAFTVIEFF
jgi:hypothetical protein